MTRTRNIVLAAIVAVTLVGCGPKGGPPPNMDPVGTWEHTAAFHARDDLMNYEMTLNINSDSTFTLDSSGDQSKGTWVLVDRLLTLTYSEVKGVAPGAGNSVVFGMTEGGNTIQTMDTGSMTVFDRVGK